VIFIGLPLWLLGAVREVIGIFGGGGEFRVARQRVANFVS